MAGSSAAYLSSRVRQGPIRTRAVQPTRASGGVTSRGPAPVPQYKERERRNVADDKLRADVLAALGMAVQPGGGPGGGGGGKPTTSGLRLPRVPVEPVAGNPYKGLDAAIGRFGQASSKRQANDVALARKALRGRADPGAETTGSFNAQAAGMASELAATISQLRTKARQDFATSELDRRSQLAKNKFDARSAQIKNDAQLLEAAGGGGLTPSMIVQLEAQGIDSSQYLNNPMGAAVALGRARYARQGEFGLPPTAYAQAAQYGLADPASYGSAQNFYWNLGQAKQGQYGTGGSDAMELLAALQSSGLLEGMQGFGQ